MSSLDNLQKYLLFNYSIGITSEKEKIEAETLISSNKEAAEIYLKLKFVLSPLDSLESEDCPDELADRTIRQLNSLAHPAQHRLEKLLVTEQSRHPVMAKSRFWWNLGEMIATAAVIVFVAAILLPSLNFARQKYRQIRCPNQLAQIFQGVNNYSVDHNGKLPAVATVAGEPWWKVGYQGEENQSNTRNIWLLAKDGYVSPTAFVCCGKQQGRVIRINPSELMKYNDFPNRNCINYSLQLMTKEQTCESHRGKMVLMADSNPLFEKLPANYSEPLNIQLNGELLTINSINHNRRGQNVLFSDGSVNFIKVRRIGIGDDDIFTLQDTNVYTGVEVPHRDGDVFLAP